MKAVIHVHTDYSYDANATCADVVAAARRQGVGCVAVTDHDEIDGALAVRALGGVEVIVGEEVSTADGHLIGLFLRERIPPGLSAEETAARIRAQGGLVLAPHPRAWLCDHSLSADTLERLAPRLDAVEVCNAQNPLVWEDAWAQRFARRHGLASYVGSDSHLRGHLAAGCQVLPAFDGPAGFLAALRRARLQPGRFGPAYFAALGGREALWRLTGRALPGFGGRRPGRGPAVGGHLPPAAGAPGGEVR